MAAGAPNADVVVTGYPRLFSPEYGAYLGASVAEQQTLNEGADLLNATMARAAATHGFQFVDVTKRFLGHGVNAPDAWILGLLDPGAFHPNAEGSRDVHSRRDECGQPVPAAVVTDLVCDAPPPSGSRGRFATPCAEMNGVASKRL